MNRPIDILLDPNFVSETMKPRPNAGVISCASYVYPRLMRYDMTGFQSAPGATVAMTVSGTPFIRIDSGYLIQDGHCVLKGLSLNGLLLLDNSVRLFNVIAPGTFPGTTRADSAEISLELNVRTMCHTHLQELPHPETQIGGLPEVQQAPVKDSAWWRFPHRPKANNKPNQKAMLIGFLFHGCIHLPQGHPQYEERKSILLRKGFHFNGKRGAWVPDPNWSTDPA